MREITELEAQIEELTRQLKPLKEQRNREGLRRVEEIKSEISILITEARNIYKDLGMAFSFMNLVPDNKIHNDPYWDPSNCY